MPRRLACVALLAAAALAWPAAAQERSVRVVSDAAAGGSSDFVSRLVAEAAGPLLGARAVVENRTGANGVVAAAEVARSAPDGSTVFTCPMSTVAITLQLVGVNLPIDPGAELAHRHRGALLLRLRGGGERPLPRRARRAGGGASAAGAGHWTARPTGAA